MAEAYGARRPFRCWSLSTRRGSSSRCTSAIHTGIKEELCTKSWMEFWPARTWRQPRIAEHNAKKKAAEKAKDKAQEGQRQEAFQRANGTLVPPVRRVTRPDNRPDFTTDRLCLTAGAAALRDTGGFFLGRFVTGLRAA